MKLLLHCCCGPCAVYPLEILKPDHNVTLYWNNFNIHPALEYLRRLDVFRQVSIDSELPKVEEGGYQLNEFMEATKEDWTFKKRCVPCYRIRFEQTVQYAKNNGFDGFTSTLFVSPYQDHETMKKVCEELAEEYGVRFVYQDFRVGFRQGQQESRNREYYMQAYCGCVFSEEDRYAKKLKRSMENG